MKHYFVKVKVQAGEYQKIVSKLVESDSESEACNMALLNECHGDNPEWHDGGIIDMRWEFYYTILSIKVHESGRRFLNLYSILPRFFT
ncbi:MAG: hypothetical protein GX029_01795 [Pseudomonadaceae bacterium]|nr:hypothetical protein [Pseudomonadaceae bacterium]